MSEFVSEPWDLVQWSEGSVMITSVISVACVLFDDNPLCVSRPAA